MNSYINMIAEKNSKSIEWVHSITCLTFSCRNYFQITLGSLLKYQREVSIERILATVRVVSIMTLKRAFIILNFGVSDCWVEIIFDDKHLSRSWWYPDMMSSLKTNVSLRRNLDKFICQLLAFSFPWR